MSTPSRPQRLALAARLLPIALVAACGASPESAALLKTAQAVTSATPAPLASASAGPAANPAWTEAPAGTLLLASGSVGVDLATDPDGGVAAGRIPGSAVRQTPRPAGSAGHTTTGLPAGTIVSLPDGSVVSIPDGRQPFDLSGSLVSGINSSGTVVTFPSGTMVTFPQGTVVTFPTGRTGPVDISDQSGLQIELPSGVQVSFPPAGRVVVVLNTGVPVTFPSGTVQVSFPPTPAPTPARTPRPPLPISGGLVPYLPEGTVVSLPDGLSVTFPAPGKPFSIPGDLLAGVSSRGTTVDFPAGTTVSFPGGTVANLPSGVGGPIDLSDDTGLTVEFPSGTNVSLPTQGGPIVLVLAKKLLVLFPTYVVHVVVNPYAKTPGTAPN